MKPIERKRMDMKTIRMRKPEKNIIELFFPPLAFKLIAVQGEGKPELMIFDFLIAEKFNFP